MHDPVRDAFPLSPFQEGLFFLYEMDRSSPAYNVSLAVRARSDVDFDALQRAWTALTTRHSQLRTTFHRRGSALHQRLKDRGMRMVRIDASKWSDHQLRSEIAAAHRRPFDLAEGASRAAFYAMGGSGGVLVITFHHIVTDLTSLDVVMHELGLLYESSSHPALAPIGSYEDFVAAHRGGRGDNGEASRRFWEDFLAGADPDLDLVKDRATRPSVHSKRSSVASFRMERHEVDALRALHPNLLRSFFAAYAVLLGAFRRERPGRTWQMTIGMPADVRGSEHATSVGYCINMLPIPVDVDTRATFRETLREVEARLRLALPHRHHPFSELVRLLRPKDKASSTQIVQASFSFYPYHHRRVGDVRGAYVIREAPWEARLGPLAVEAFPILQQEATHEVQLRAAELADGSVVGELHGDADFYDVGTVEVMRDHLGDMLSTIARDPDVSVHALAALQPARRPMVLREWNATAREQGPAACVHELFEAQVQRTPDAVAVMDDRTSLTYAELDVRAERIAAWLAGQGLEREGRVAISVSRSVDMLAAVLGVLKAGGAYVPLDVTLPSERRELVKRDAGYVIELTDATLASALASDSSAATDRSRRRRVSPRSLAYILYTSGSTGLPKGVMIEHRSVVNLIRSLLREPGLSPSDVGLALTTLSFDVAGAELFVPLAAGARVVIASNETARDPALLAAAIERFGATVAGATPATWQLLTGSGWRPPATMSIHCAGEALSPDLAEQLLADGAVLWNLYGPTETTIYSTGCRVTRGQRVSIGRPVDNTRVYLLDERMAPVPVGAVGRLFIAGDGLARGYLNRPELTAASFVPDPFAALPGARMYDTGDFARWLPDGSLDYLGRRDRQIKLRGFRIELGDIEAALRSIAGVREAVVTVREDEGAGPRLVGYAVGDGSVALDAAMIRSTLRDKLPDYMIPSFVMILDALPRTASGKLDRKALPAPAVLEKKESTAAADGDSDGDEFEEVLVSIWKDVLGVSEVGAHDDFFDLGGHSLLATQLVVRIHDVLGLEIPVRTVFDSPTFADFGERVLDAMLDAEA